MSIKSYILLCLLCLSSHACNARPLGSHLSSKNNEDDDSLVKISALPNGQTSISKELDVDEIKNLVKENKDDEENSNKNDHKAVEEIKSAHRQTESLVSVDWRVPHKTRGEQQPGFNLDYSPPKTHPPVHN